MKYKPCEADLKTLDDFCKIDKPNDYEQIAALHAIMSILRNMNNWLDSIVQGSETKGG